jgi:Calcineurin-like phosphoesterase
VRYPIADMRGPYLGSAMSLACAIPDRHGRRDLLDAALDRIAGHAAGGPATVVLLGDSIDCGPDSRQVIDRLIDFYSEKFRLIPLKGNHEEMMRQACNRLDELELVDRQRRRYHARLVRRWMISEFFVRRGVDACHWPGGPLFAWRRGTGVC